MKNLTIILSALTLVAMVNSNVQAQYIAGDNDVCSDQTLSYLAEEPEGITFRKWLGVNPYLASGSYEWDIEIWIDWSLVSASSFYLAWTGRFGGGGINLYLVVCLRKPINGQDEQQPGIYQQPITHKATGT